MTVVQAIEEFRAAAIAKADFATPASRDHTLHERMARAFDHLASHGSAGLAAFNALLRDESPYVRSWVAAELLSQGDKSAVPVMEELASESGIRGLTATITLKEFHAGRLHSPFKIKDD
jgi:hypothetical protein